MRAKKVLSILFALALVLSSLPASAIAESIEDAGKYSVVVSYVNVLNDEEIHAPSKQVVNEGESWSHVSKSGVRLFPYYLLAYIMPPLYKR